MTVAGGSPKAVHSRSSVMTVTALLGTHCPGGALGDGATEWTRDNTCASRSPRSDGRAVTNRPAPGSMTPAPTPAVAVEVELVCGVGDVDVGVVVAAGDGVDGEEPSGGGVVEADSHEGEAGEVVGGALFGAEPAVGVGCGGGVAGCTVFGGFAVADTGSAGVIGAGRHDVTVHVGQVQGHGPGLVDGARQASGDADEVAGPGGRTGAGPGG